MGRRFLVSSAFVLGLAAPLMAHEFWLTPSSWVAAPGGRVTLLANVGDRFANASSFTTPDRVESVRLVGPQTDQLVPGPYRRERDSLAADVQLPTIPGVYAGIFVVKPRVGEKTGAIFEEHLRHQGLSDIAAERSRNKETHVAVRERYSRYGKTLMQVGTAGADSIATRPLGLKIELVPLRNPIRLRPGDRLRLRLLLDGQPAAGALVGAIDADAKVAADEWPVSGRTDAKGEVGLTLPRRGPWLVRAVRMQRRSAETGPEAADWETYWASLTFVIGP
jgi:uncharacterized GH25 family protein